MRIKEFYYSQKKLYLNDMASFVNATRLLKVK
jgi:hypothetical protein